MAELSFLKNIYQERHHLQKSINILLIKITVFLWRNKTIIFIFRMPDLSSLPSKQQKRHFVYHLKDDGIFPVCMKNEND